MLVTTAEPLTFDQMIGFSKTKDALIDLDVYKCRYMRTTEGQEIEVPIIYYDNRTDMTFGLRPVKDNRHGYDYLAFRIYE